MKRYRLLILALTTLIVCSCTFQNKNNDIGESIMINATNNTTENIELNGFYDMINAERTATEHSLTDITKILYYEFGFTSTDRSVAIDIANLKMITEPVIRKSMDYYEPDYIMNTTEVNEVLEILNNNQVLSWNSEYGTPDIDSNTADGGGWSLFIQYNDNTVSHFIGYGGYSDIYPDTYSSFVEDILAFTHSKRAN